MSLCCDEWVREFASYSARDGHAMGGRPEARPNLFEKPRACTAAVRVPPPEAMAVSGSHVLAAGRSDTLQPRPTSGRGLTTRLPRLVPGHQPDRSGLISAETPDTVPETAKSYRGYG